MGWFSDALFGKRKRINHKKLNDYQKPYLKMVDEQEDISRQMMDPNSRMNRELRQRLFQNQSNQLAQGNQQLSKLAAQTGMSPAQLMMQQRMSQNTAMGNMSEQTASLDQQRWGQGLGLLQQVMGARQGEAERLSNMHIQNVNAHNQRRQQRMGTFTGLLGMGIQGAASIKTAFGGER